MQSLHARERARRSLSIAILAALVVVGATAGAWAQGPGGRTQLRAFDRPALIEVLSMPSDEAREAIEQAREALAMIKGSFDESEGNAAAQISAAAGQGPIKVAPVLFELLGRAWQFCQWSHGAHGPLATDLYALWGLPHAVTALPTPEEIQAGIAMARCDRMALDPEQRTVELAGSTHLQLWGFSMGYAIDLAVTRLKEAGATNGRVIVGRIARGFGLGPNGQGWPIDLPAFSSIDGRKPTIFLRDASVAVISSEDFPISIEGKSYPPYLDQRSGRPPERMIATITVTELAVDAQALGVSTFVMGSREGLAQMTQIRPAPSILWVEGSRESEPLLMQHRWNLVPR